MGSSSPSGNQVTKTEPPSYQLPYLQEGLGYARGLFAEGGPQQYGGSTVVPFAPQTEKALAGIEQRATNGSPLTEAGQGYVQDTLNGKYLDQQNPYLQATFDKAAQATQASLEGQYAGTGRNVQASIPQRTDMLTSLATQIYGGAYDAERNRQQGALPYVSPLAESDYRDLSALQGVGAQVEDLSGRYMEDAARRWDTEQNRPGATLDSYLQRISGNMGTTQSTPIYRNRTAGGVGGAVSGAQLGSYFGPWGALLGGVGGGLLGAYG
jgi:hypothetical protein